MAALLTALVRRPPPLPCRPPHRSLPTVYPVERENFNYAPVSLAGTLLLAVGSYPLFGRRYRGPAFDVEAFDAQILLDGQDASKAGHSKDVVV